MSENSTDDDKQYEASQQKLDEARKKGDFARSTDLNTAAAYLGMLVMGFSVGAATLISAGEALAGLLVHASKLSEDVFEGSGAPMTGSVLMDLAAYASPWFAIPAIFVIVSIIAQRGFVFAPTKLEPKLSRISPISQAKNKFGRSGLFEFAKSFAKLVLYSVVLFVFLYIQLPDILATMALTPGQVIATLLQMSLMMLGVVLVIAAALGVVDYVFQQADHLRKNRMSRKELTDELKNSEGDPMMKQQRRQKAMAIASNQMMKDVPDADVVIVNPTHYAVALKWNRGGGGAPECVAKGVDLVAASIREVAQEHGVPIHSDPPTARALHATVEIGQEIKQEHYKAVAAAIRFADRVRKLAR